MTQHGILHLGIVQEGDLLIQELGVTGLLHIGGQSVGRPQSGVGVGTVVDGVPATHRHTEVVLIAQSLLQDGLGALGVDVDHAQTVLHDVTIAVIAPTAPGSAVHTGQLGPVVQQTVQVLVAGLDLGLLQIALAIQLSQCGVGGDVVQIGLLQLDATLLAVAGTQNELDVLHVAVQFNIPLQHADGILGGAVGVGADAVLDADGVSHRAVLTHKQTAGAVVVADGIAGGEESGQVVVRLHVGVLLGQEHIVLFVEGGGAIDHIAVAVKAPLVLELQLEIGEHGQVTGAAVDVLQLQLPHLDGILSGGDGDDQSGLHVLGLVDDGGVAQVVGAGEVLHVGTDGLPVHSPELAGLVVAHVDDAGVQVLLTENIVVADTTHAGKQLDALLTGVLVVETTDTGVVNVGVAHVVEQHHVKGTGCVRRGDYKLVAFFVEMSVVHC